MWPLVLTSLFTFLFLYFFDKRYPVPRPELCRVQDLHFTYYGNLEEIHLEDI